MIHHGTVELLHAAPALAPLEILHRVAAVSHRLQGLQGVHSRPLKLVHRLPVHKTRRAFHQHKGSFLQAAEEIMPKSSLAGGIQLGIGVPIGIGIPGNHIDMRRKVPVIQRIVAPHHIGSDRYIRRDRLDGSDLRHARVFSAQKSGPLKSKPLVLCNDFLPGSPVLLLDPGQIISKTGRQLRIPVDPGLDGSIRALGLPILCISRS